MENQRDELIIPRHALPQMIRGLGILEGYFWPFMSRAYFGENETRYEKIVLNSFLSAFYPAFYQTTFSVTFAPLALSFFPSFSFNIFIGCLLGADYFLKIIPFRRSPTLPCPLWSYLK
jgi:hypothetical protein